MKRTLIAAAFAVVSAGAAFAHAQLQSASPPVGGAVEAPKEIRLSFSEALEAKFCKLTLKNAAGAAQSTSAPALAPGDAKSLVVKLPAKLAPGAYTVEWRAVSVDTHRTEGHFDFTVK